MITPTMDHTMSMQPASMMGPLTQQMNHLSLGTTGTVRTYIILFTFCIAKHSLLTEFLNVIYCSQVFSASPFCHFNIAMVYFDFSPYPEISGPV